MNTQVFFHHFKDFDKFIFFFSLEIYPISYGINFLVNIFFMLGIFFRSDDTKSNPTIKSL